jgi:hypothetical protein
MIKYVKDKFSLSYSKVKINGIIEKYILKYDQKRIFNAGICKFYDNYMVCFRSGEHTTELNFLNSDFTFSTNGCEETPGLTDPKIIDVGGDQYKLIGSWPPNGQEYMEMLDFSAKKHKIEYFENKKRLKTVLNYPNYKPRREKSWAPFYKKNNLYFIYKKNPHEILIYDANLESVVYLPECSFDNSKLTIHGSEIRGNGTACYFDSNMMITTFHVKMLNYYVLGYYTFEAEHPFRPHSYCNKMLIDSREYAVGARKGPLIRNNASCVFPGGVIDEGETILMSLGVNDAENHFLRYDKNWLADNLIKF